MCTLELKFHFVLKFKRNQPEPTYILFEISDLDNKLTSIRLDQSLLSNPNKEISIYFDDKQVIQY